MKPAYSLYWYNVHTDCIVSMTKDTSSTTINDSYLVSGKNIFHAYQEGRRLANYPVYYNESRIWRE